MALKWVGTISVPVMPRSHSARNVASGSKSRSTSQVPPRKTAAMANANPAP